ncbi:MAG: hydrogenase nickel incorporation protein HypB, partial [Desulfobacterales bacterium]|nr:hydrogenase nickel incorporation protein HypB [Desulfobacterales bacterium]
MRVAVVKNILDANSRIAKENRKLFDDHNLTVINLMSSPGAGKTTLLEQMGTHFAGQMKIGVIEGDIQTTLDAERVAAAGLQAVQIETDGACHLDANMIQNALENLDLATLDLLIVENVGNLVCPAEFNVGENLKVMMLSVTEGDDKPYKYPLMFRESQVLLISKVELLPHLRCDIEKIK